MRSTFKVLFYLKRDKQDIDYWCNFDHYNTKRLVTVLSGQSEVCDDIQKMLAEHFSGLDGLCKLKQLCRRLEINFNYGTY